MNEVSSRPAGAVCWVVSDGRRGIENQALGLAEAIARALPGPLHIERVTVRKDGFVALPRIGHPDLWIGCGRAAVPLAMKHRQIFPECRFVYVQDPRRRYRDFDLIVAPSHDRLRKRNALAMTGSPNRITPDVLASAKSHFADRLAALPEPRAAVLIGGPSKRFKLDDGIADYLERRLDGWLARGLGLMVTVSRRTPDAVRERLKARFAQDARVWFHDGEGENPYFAFLAAADWIFVTEESTNMLVEAASTGTPVYALPMAGRPGKFARLHAELDGRDAVRPYLGELDRWHYTPVDDTQRLAARLARDWQAHLLKPPPTGDAA